MQHLAFPPSLGPRERQAVHQAAAQAGLRHASVGEGAERRLLVSKASAPATPDVEELSAADAEAHGIAWLPRNVLASAHAAPVDVPATPSPAGRRRRSNGRRPGGAGGGLAGLFGPSSL